MDVHPGSQVSSNHDAHVALAVPGDECPGIVGLFATWPNTGRVLSELAEELLRGPHTLTRGERELIGAYVSGLNACTFCCNSHSAFAAAQLPAGMDLVQRVRDDLATAPVSEKLRTLLRVAGAVQQSGRTVTREMIEAARAQGATDSEIHHTVLIAAAFCMFNRYVDGLGTFTPPDAGTYAGLANHIVTHGYVG
jgi:uncharacterized peroxidase-related enzyme